MILDGIRQQSQDQEGRGAGQEKIILKGSYKMYGPYQYCTSSFTVV